MQLRTLTDKCMEGVEIKATDVRNGCSTFPPVLGQVAGSFKFFLSSKCPYNVFPYVVFLCFYLDNLSERLLRAGLGLHSYLHSLIKSINVCLMLTMCQAPAVLAWVSQKAEPETSGSWGSPLLGADPRESGTGRAKPRRRQNQTRMYY